LWISRWQGLQYLLGSYKVPYYMVTTALNQAQKSLLSRCTKKTSGRITRGVIVANAQPLQQQQKSAAVANGGAVVDSTKKKNPSPAVNLIPNNGR